MSPKHRAIPSKKLGIHRYFGSGVSKLEDGNVQDLYLDVSAKSYVRPLPYLAERDLAERDLAGRVGG